MSRAPSIAPHVPEKDTYFVLDDFGGRIGRAWRETDEDAVDRETLILNLLSGEYKNRFASLPSIPLKDGAEMQPWTLPTSCADVA